MEIINKIDVDNLTKNQMWKLYCHWTQQDVKAPRKELNWNAIQRMSEDFPSEYIAMIVKED